MSLVEPRPADRQTQSWRSDWTVAALCGVLYYAAAQAALLFVVQPEGLAVIWPSAGVLLGFLLFARRRVWLPILLVVFAGVIHINLVHGNAFGLSLAFAGANCFGPLAVAVAVLSVVGRCPKFDESRDVTWFIVTAAAVTPVVALVGAAAVVWGIGGTYWQIWQVWWLEDAMGMLVVTPLVLEANRAIALRQFRWPAWDWSAAVGAGGAAVSSVWVFLIPSAPALGYLARPYLPVPFVGYIALRFGPIGAVACNTAVALAVLTGLAFDVGAFETFASNNRDQALGAQLFLAVTCITTLIAGAVAAERRRIERSLRLSEASLAEAQSIARLGSWRVEFRPLGDVWTVSDELNRVWGDPPGTRVTNESGYSRIHPDDRARVADAWSEAVRSAGPSEWDHRATIGGEERWIAVHAQVERDHAGRPVAMSGTNQDITARKRAEERLRRYADAQRGLLREVNHRVKNNLSALLAVVHLEQDRAEAQGQTAVGQSMRELDGRLRSLATVHAMLSLSEWRPVRLRDLCERMITEVARSRIGSIHHLRITDSTVVVDANQAHHLAMAVSELATNSFKYGGDPLRLVIDVEIQVVDTDVRLTYRDHGPGYPSSVFGGDRTAMHVGLEMVRGLVEQSLRGRLTLSNDGGAVVAIGFPMAGQGAD